MSNKRYTIQFGYLELCALHHALGNSIDYDDVLDSLFPDRRDKLAVRRAARKISTVLRFAGTPKEDE